MPVQLETVRLVLREPLHGDAERLLDFGDDEVLLPSGQATVWVPPR